MKMSKDELNFVFLADRQDAISTVAQWYYELWGKVPGNSVEQTIERIKGKLNCDKPPFHILAISKDRVLGVAQFKLREMSIYPEKEFWLGSLFVSPEFRGCGIGSALAEEIVVIAKKFGVKEIYLQTEALDGGLYKRLGWKTIETIENNSVLVAVMVRQLAM
ncbi:GNAT family N-acetyltransferase [Synechocystis sp. PCC 7509]|uniref:GNAT family N-acetyltransferase n=1 Tax=Synechocystis sp. PCC 7509 TaxID=927677 RepID=UPI0002AC95DD|nr:GNAT family N-acetyltransferase [Synechocystis sp. PCC 7509]